MQETRHEERQAGRQAVSNSLGECKDLASDSKKKVLYDNPKEFFVERKQRYRIGPERDS